MADFVLDADVRTVVGKKVSRLRKEGLVPITVYGPKTDAMSLQVPYRVLELCLLHAGGTNLISVNADGKTHTVLAREVQRDVLRGTITHVDFFAVDMKAKIRAEIPINFVGESPAVEGRLGIMITGTNSLTVEMLPGKLIHEVEIDLSGLEAVGDSIMVGDLHLGDDVNIINDPEELLVRISVSSAARAAEDEEGEGEELEEEVVSGSEPELIRRREDEDADED